VPKESAAGIPARAKVDTAWILELESRVKHDVIAFTMAIGKSIGDRSAGRWLHYGLPSNEVVDTAQALLVRDASRLMEAALVKFVDALEKVHAEVSPYPPKSSERTA